MKEQISIQELAAKLDSQVKSRKDYVANSMALEMVKNEDDLVIKGLNGNAYGITDWAHQQLASSLNIPKRYYDRMKVEYPELLAQNVNAWFKREPEKNRLVRTLDNKVRAFLSDSYRPLDNFDLAATVIPIISEGQCTIRSCALTETHMYIKASQKMMTAEVLKGDIVEAGIVISNSEVGAGAVKVEPLILRLVCLNGMIAADRSLRKYHIGKGIEADLDMRILTTEARQADDKAFWLKVRDIVKSAFNETFFMETVSKMRGATENKIINPNVVEVIENLQEKYLLTDKVGQNIMQHLISGGDLSQYGLLNAATRASQDSEDYTEATELERLGGKVLELSRKDWSEIAA